MRLPLALGLCAVGIACSSAPQATVEERCAEGLLRVRSPGQQRQVSLVLDAGAEIQLGDSQAPDLGFLNGTRTRVCGSDAPDSSLEVLRYDLVSVDGQTAYMGTLIGEEQSFYLRREATNERIRLIGVPPPLEDAVGGRVWVSGRVFEGEMQVGSFGVFPG